MQAIKFDLRSHYASHYALIKSVMQDKAKEQHKPSLADKASMQAYALATGNIGKACFNLPKADYEAINYV